MVPAETILQKAKQEEVDIIGLSGLITPSLDEMVHVAKEMTRQGFDIPLMIGGATTSKAHTSVKIEPEYQHGAVYVHDASRAVGVASTLLSVERRDEFLSELKKEYADVRRRRAAKSESKNLIPIADARANPTVIEWEKSQAVTPLMLNPGYVADEGFRITGEHNNLLVADDIPLEQITPYIDWTFFFHAWQMKGRFPKILDDAVKGEEARKLFADAESMLQQIIAEKWLRASAVVGLFPANAVGDDIEIYTDDSRQQLATTLQFLRKQGKQPRGKQNESLADYVAPKSTGISDYIGGFAATAGIGIDEKISEFESDHDDYSALMLKALADRLAEALTEWLHLKVRKEIWGYAADEELGNNELIAEKYHGIRPAMGYPASPDHTEKDLLWDLLDAEKNTGIWLTESKAMVPTAAVSGLYFAHPQSRYFAVGKLNRDQLADYAARKGVELAEMERWLGQNLAYEPE